MDNLLETIDEIKTLIPDSKYMTLMESMGKIHKKSMDRITHYNLKQFISFLLKASEQDSTISYMNASKWGANGIDNGTFYNILIKCKSGFDCREAGNAWLEILETSYPKEKFNVVDHLPKCEFKNYNWCNSIPSPRGERSDEKVIELYFSFDNYDEDDFVNEHGWVTGFNIEDANSIGKSCLTMMAKTLVEKYL